MTNLSFHVNPIQSGRGLAGDPAQAQGSNPAVAGASTGHHGATHHDRAAWLPLGQRAYARPRAWGRDDVRQQHLYAQQERDFARD